MVNPASVTMMGRAADLAVLRDAFAQVLGGRPRAALVGGEAGIGKTRLVREFAAEVADRSVVLVGQSTDLGLAGSPLAPVRHIVRGLVEEFGADAVVDAAGSYAPALGSLHPDLRREDDPADGDLLPEAIATALRELSNMKPLVVVIEDLQWADAATLSLLRPLLHLLAEGRVFAILTYRSDDVGRGHPVRAVLAELERSRAVERIELRRLTQDEAEALVLAITGEVLGSRRVRELAARSDGVPFLAEELVGVTATADGPLPDTLRDLVLARYERLSPAAQAIVRMIAVGGVTVDHDLLVAVHGGDSGALEGGIGEAIAENVVVTTATAYQFRHALTRDAVSEIQLPGERVRVNAAYARGLEAMPDRADYSARIAHHWLAAHDLPKAFASTIEAMGDAEKSYATATAAEMGERALELWPGVPDAAALANTDLVSLMRRTADDLGDAGELMRAIAMLEEAYRLVDPDDVRLRAEILLDLSVQASSVEGLALRPYLDEAIALLESGLGADTSRWEPEDQRLAARLNATQSVFRANYGNMPEALELAQRAQRQAAAAEDNWQLLRARTYEARALMGLGRSEEGFDAYESVEHDARDVPSAWVRNAVFHSQELLNAGRFAQARDLAAKARETAREFGLETTWGIDLLRGIAHAAIASGDWAGADEALTAARRRRGDVDLGLVYIPLLQAQSWIAQGERARAEAEVEPLRGRVMRARESDPELAPLSVATWAMLALAAGDLDRALTEVEFMLRPGRDVLPGFDNAAVVLGAHVLGERRRAGVAVDLDAVELVNALSAGIGAHANGPVWLAIIAAEFAVDDQVRAWEGAVTAVDTGTVPLYWRVESRVGLALARAESGDLEGALVELDDASDLADRFGAVGWSDRVGRVRATLAPRSARRNSPRGPALTAREREVLGFVAEGLTNPQIGERLFISAKTVSVHVSAILRKIGVSSRTEAAVWATEHADRAEPGTPGVA